ncbi:hypothetical protein [Cryobacterium mannosilyticum]|uniref:Uncharacterized protein n=1 Tax=Cryobacterium mannosilyticum TaxID=1259190 RepID=A0A4R8WF19_9MICO|nr:hypothetical protein [Cryobacterium mannosilyticum]TFC06758.1 hypothetical protein E3O32_03335 [Cryobacterium mannosilyticum]
MSEETTTKGRLGTPVELLIGSVIGAVLGWPITKALDGLAADNKWPTWVYMIGTVIGVALVLFVMTFIVTPWRRTIWGSLGRSFKCLWSWRPVSNRGLLHVIGVLRTDMANVALEAAHQYDQQKQDLEEAKKLYVEATNRPNVVINRVAGSSIATGGPVIPLPDPRWTIIHNDFDRGVENFLLTNHVPRSFAKEVRVEGETDRNGYSEVTILDAATFEDLSGNEYGEFLARFDEHARWSGAPFEVSWYDENGTHRAQTIFVPGWEPAPPPAPSQWNSDETPF